MITRKRSVFHKSLKIETNCPVTLVSIIVTVMLMQQMSNCQNPSRQQSSEHRKDGNVCFWEEKQIVLWNETMKQFSNRQGRRHR